MMRILKSPLGPKNKYVYSDNDFIFLGKIVEEVTGLTLDQYVQKPFTTKLVCIPQASNPGIVSSWNV